MVYEVFQTAVSEELKNRLGDDYEIAIHKIPKNNGTLLDGFDNLPSERDRHSNVLSAKLL